MYRGTMVRPRVDEMFYSVASNENPTTEQHRRPGVMETLKERGCCLRFDKQIQTLAVSKSE